ncbi:MAG: LysM peptidoglycan-binding domain-containing protein [Phycisphaerae bacterium]
MLKRLAIFAIAALAAVAQAGPRNQELFRKLSLADKRALEGLRVMETGSLEQIAQVTRPESLRAQTEKILSLGSLFIGARQHDEEGYAPIHRYLMDQIAQTPGVEPIGTYMGNVPVPVAVELSEQAEQIPSWKQGSLLEVEGRQFEVLPFWPNGALPTLAPAEGFTGPLIYVGKGDWKELRGLDLTGAIVLMDFEAGRAWDRLFSLGAKAAIAIEGDILTRRTAENWFCNTPVPMPRFYVTAEQGEKLKQFAMQRDPADPTKILPGKSCKLRGGNVYEERPFRSLFAYLPPTEPVRYTVGQDELLERIALQHGVSLDELLELNKLEPGTIPDKGTKLDIPGQDKTYEVAENDLLSRLATEFGLPAEAVVQANSSEGSKLVLPLRAGQRLTIPNLEESVLISVPIDSVSSVPEAPHGAKVASNLAIALATMRHLAEGEGVVRRKGMVFAFLDAEHLGGRTSKGFAEYVLLAKGEFGKTVRSKTVDWGNVAQVAVITFLLAGLLGGGVYLVVTGKREKGQPRPMSQRLPKAGLIAAIVGVSFAVLYLVPKSLQSFAGTRWEEDPTLERYEEAHQWLETDWSEPLNDDTARWLASRWLRTRVEKQLAEISEEQKDRRSRINEIDLAVDEGQIDQAQADKQTDEIYDEIDRITENIVMPLAQMRDQTLDNRLLDWTQRCREFLEKLPQQDGPDVDLPLLTIRRLRARMSTELAQTRQQNNLRENNIELARKVMDRLHPGQGLDSKTPVLGWLLDLTDGSASMGIDSMNNFRKSNPSHLDADKLLERYQKVLAFASVQVGWSEDWGFLVAADSVAHPVIKTDGAVAFPEFWVAAEVASRPFWTQNDVAEKLDTPRDTVENTNFQNLSIQGRNLLTVLRHGLEFAPDSMPPARIKKKPQLGVVEGKVTQFNMRSGIEATDPVAGALVYYPALRKEAANKYNSSTFRGTRRGALVIAPLNGFYRLPLEDKARSNPSWAIFSYRLDPESGLFDMAVNEARVGSQSVKKEFDIAGGEILDHRLIMTELYPKVIFPGADPRDYVQLGSNTGEIRLQDYRKNGAPDHYAIDAAGQDYQEVDIQSLVIYSRPGRRVRVLAREGKEDKMLLVGQITDRDEKTRKGIGYPVGPGKQDRNLTLPYTPLLVAGDTLELTQRPRKLYEDHGITDRSVGNAVDRGAAKYKLALEAQDELDHQAAIGKARESWGILAKAYARIKALGREAVFSVVVLMALLLPASVFLERLVIGRKSILGRLAGTVIIFILGTTFLNYFHPAFKISVSPFIVMIAFTMILMASIVLIISYQRFEVLVRRARMAGGEVESEEISLASSLGTALSMGVSNLKKRPARTFLTVFTVTVLTFSIVCFVSVSGSDELGMRPIELDPVVEREGVTTPEPIEPQYKGVLFREYQWAEMKETFISAIRSEFGSQYEIATRGFYIQVEGGNNLAREGVNQVKVRYQPEGASKPREDTLTAIMGFEPIETRFSGLNQAVTNNAWFQPGDRDVTILPDNAAERLGITEEMIFDEQGNRRPMDQLPVVRAGGQGRLWRVVGILDTYEANRMRDLNGKSLAVVDFMQSGITPSVGSGDVANEQPSYHLDWSRLMIVPMAAKDEAQIKARSLAIRFRQDKTVTVQPGDTLESLAREHMGTDLQAGRILDANESLSSAEDLEAGMEITIPGDDTDRFRRDLALRINRTMFGNVGGQMAMITTLTQRSVGGLAKILVPVILCVLIVLNTMLANVDERKGEVGMLGAIGLSPGQISFLLLSESLVFSILGIVLGTFGGLLFANIVRWVHQSDPTFLAGLSFNFTSLSSMALAMGTGVVVLLATLIPARRAAAMAAPSGMANWELPEPTEAGEISFDLPFTLTRGNGVGMTAFFRQFLYNHSDPASSDFNCREIQLSMEHEPVEALKISAHMWLAPYDLDVAQILTLRVMPTENEGVFKVNIHLHRQSGTEDAWMRTNYGFMDLVRRQFLLWRNLDNASREAYIELGADLFKNQAREPQETTA